MKNVKAKPGTPEQETPNVWVVDCDVVIDNYNKNNPTLRKLTQRDLADQIGVTSQLLTDWKKRDVKAIQVIKKMAEIGECSMEDFIKPLK